ncbi:MAG: adenylate/guanylate cyclase domain-containing protein [Leptospiraceae bacterium]|nr:adenylate/guanylate cyclase domain-containing protein [Leptospiraceae bacterium]
MNRKEFLEKYPWSRWDVDPDQERIVEDLWVFPLEVSRESFWPYIADTSRTNSLLGLPEMEFRESDGRLLGKTKYAGILHEWEEVPWQWRRPEELISVRIYSRGLGKMVRGIFYMEDVGPEKTNVHIYFGWVARNPFGAAFLKVGTSRMRKGFEKVLRQYEAEIQGAGKRKAGPALQIEKPVITLDDKARSIVDQTRKLWDEKKVPFEISEALVRIVTRWDDVDLYRIRPMAVSRQLGLDPGQLLRALLYGTRSGLFNLTWDVICPHCRGVREEKGSLMKLEARGSCDVCQIDFDATGEESLEITFHVSPSVRNVRQQFFCSAEPARKPHIALQERLNAGEQRDVTLNLGEGRHRARLQGSQTFFWMEAGSGETRNYLNWEAGQAISTDGIRLNPRPTLHLVNPDQSAHTFVVDRTDADNEVLRPGDLFALPEYRELYPDERLPEDLKIDIGIQTILFTDIVGSSRMYNDLGDSGAFRRVRDHFASIGEVVSAHHGTVIKTVGDAVFAAFGNPVDGFRAALELKKRFLSGQTEVSIRISVHTGPCLAVNLDTGIDYFGNTVNLCAKLQALAGAGQIAFTDALLQNPLIRDELRSVGRAQQVELPESLQWIQEPVYRI